MSNFKILTISLFLLTGSVLTVWSESLLIATHIRMPLKSMDRNEMVKVSSMESGIMETLFDDGHVFFNIYNHPKADGESMTTENLISMSGKLDSDYLLELIPDESGTVWNLYRTSNSRRLIENHENISQVDDSYNFEKRWYALGQILGRAVTDAITVH